MKKKRLLSCMLAAGLSFGCLTGCGSSGGGSNATVAAATTQADTAAKTEAASGDHTISVVTTIFPEYDWTKTILGDKAENVDLKLLLDNGADLHSYTPSVEDIATIQGCDLFIYVGGESDEWVDDVLANAENKDMVVINLLDVLGDSVKNEEIVEGMEHQHEHEEGEEDHEHEEAEEDHDHEHEEAEEDHDHEEAEEDHEHEHEEEKDEHVWLSLKNAIVLSDKITEALGTVDAQNKDYYRANFEAYKTELTNLDAEYKTAVDGASKKTLLFADRFPFRYLVDDYGITYYAAFTGCSAESEASFETVIFLAEKVDELGLPAIMTIDGSTQKIALTVKDNTSSKDQKILMINSMQTTTAADVAAGTTYLSVMKANLDVLKEALQ